MAANSTLHEKDWIQEASYHETLRQIQSAGSINIPKEIFEKLYLSPQNNVQGDLRKTFGNPTPL
jgi:hypothetical protein